MLNICLTFDYEFFFGENNKNDEEILYFPTDNLLKVLEEESVSASFFIDVCAYERMVQEGLQTSADTMRKQIQKMQLSGQDVELHIHPHWMKSEYKNGKWIFPKEYYRLHAYGLEETGKIISTAKNELERIVQEVDPDYRCVAYRAGGFAIQPHEEVIRTLVKNGIVIDSSIAPQLFSDTETNSYDYRSKDNLTNWWISSEYSWDKEGLKSGSCVYEVPIATIDKNPIVYLFQRLFMNDRIRLILPSKTGSFIDEDSRTAKRVSLYKRLSGYGPISMDIYHYTYIYKLLCRYYKKNKCGENDITVAIIGHPKLANGVYAENMRKLIRLLRSDERFNFCNMKDIQEKQIKLNMTGENIDEQ